MSMATVALPEIDEEILDRLEPLYNLILLDDDDHTYDYVVEMLVKIFGFSETVAFRHAVEVDTEGRTLLLTAPLEEVQAKREQSLAEGDVLLITPSPKGFVPSLHGELGARAHPLAEVVKQVERPLVQILFV